MRRTVLLPGLLLVLTIATGRAATAVPPPAPQVLADRTAVEQMLFQTGFSGVATMRLQDTRWTGRGAHNGVVVDFVVDARTGRIVSEVPAS